jgi:parallel beta-helix repeat protein
MTTSFRSLQHVVIVLLMALALVVLAMPANAAPESPASGGIFTVSTGSIDNTEVDDHLTLREAMLLNSGGTGKFGLNRPLTIGEVKFVSGCNLELFQQLTGPSYVIVSGCGPSISDTIRFAGGVSVVEITKTTLPSIPSATIIDGEYNNSMVILDFSKAPYWLGEHIYSNTTIKGITLRNAKCDSYCTPYYAISIIGNNNHITNFSIINIVGDGISIHGENNVIDNVRIGVPDGNISLCPTVGGSPVTGVTRHGIYLSANAQNTVIKNNVIGCSGFLHSGSGIYVESASSGTIIGPNNKIGTTGSGATAVLGNAGSGILLNGAQNVTIISNMIAYNGGSGIALAGSSSNVIGGNLIRGNHGDGIILTAASTNNKIGGPTTGSSYGGNKIGFNKSHGIHLVHLPAISPNPPSGNVIVGNWIGTLNVTNAAANKGSGIVLNGATNNKIGEAAPAAPNIIVSNEGQGIWLRGAAKENAIANNYIGTNGFTTLPNGQNGILIEEGSNKNTIGALSANAANQINHNGEVGVLLRGAGTSSNSLLNNTIANNGLEGVLITAQASNNKIGGTGLAAVVVNQIANNGRWGVALTGGAQQNSIGGNRIYRNNRAGILFADAATQHNTITSATIFENKGADGDGIAQKSGAANNSWSRIITYGNDGLGVDLEAVTGFNTVTGPYPTITNISSAAGTVTIVGTASASLINEKTVTVEVYRSASDPSNHGEGQSFVVSGQTNADGDFSLSFNGVAGCFTAFQTISEGSTKRSSEFGPNVCKGTPQTISFDGITNKTVGAAPFSVNPTASSSLPVTVSAEGTCSISPQKLVSLTGAGTCTLTATQAGNATYAPAPNKSVEFEIFKKIQSISWGSLPQYVDAAPFDLDASASSGLPVTFEAKGVCTVSNKTVTFTGQPGYCEIEASQDGNDDYYSAYGFIEHLVLKKDQTIHFDQLPNKQVTDPAFPVTASATSGLEVGFYTTTPEVCTVSENTVTLVQVGMCSLVAFQPGNHLYNSAEQITKSFLVGPSGQAGQSSIFLPLVTR